MSFVRNSVFCLLILTGLAYAKGDYRPAKDASAVKFSVSHLTNRAHGSFKEFDGKLHFSKANPSTSTVSFSVEVDSIDTDNDSRDSALRGKEYFSVAEFSQMTFQSKSFKDAGQNKYMVMGALTIKGQTKNISIPVTLTKTGTTWATGEDVLRFKGQFSVDRTEFGVGTSSALLGSEVSINLDVEFRSAR